MPKSPRTQDEINNVKENILDTALHLIIDEGFQNLSMRKIASRLGVSATTLYNYFSSKDELYFMIRIHGFELLYQNLERVYREHDDTHARLRAFIECYIKFGIDYPDYYDVMFLNRNVPKYLESIGTELETIASRDKEMGLKTLFLCARVLKELYSSEIQFTDDDARYYTIQLWCEINGIVSLHNSRLLHEVEENIAGLIDRLAYDAYNRFKE
jgi:AcrR family transcriptional regulator